MPKQKILKTVAIEAATLQEIMEFSAIEGRPLDTLIQEALELWLDAKHKDLLEKNLSDENTQTNLSYDEFWDGVEI